MCPTSLLVIEKYGETGLSVMDYQVRGEVMSKILIRILAILKKIKMKLSHLFMNSIMLSINLLSVNT